MPKPTYFLLHPRHADFVEGRAPWPPLTWRDAIGSRSLLIIAAALIIGLFSFVMLMRHLHSQRQLQQEGVITEGQIIRHYSETSKDKYNRQYYYLDYSFASSDGRTYYRTQEVNREFYQRIQPNQSIPIRYLPSNPSRSEVAQEGAKAGGINGFWSLLCGSIITIPIVLKFTVFSEATMRRYRLQQGTLIEATLLEIRKTKTQLKVVCQFHSPQSQQFIKVVVHGKPLPPNKKPPLVGSKLYILYYNDQIYEVM